MSTYERFTMTLRFCASRSSAAAKLLALAYAAIAAAPAESQTPVFFGDTLALPGVYFLAGNQSGTGVGIRIESDDVVLLLGRFTLRGNGTSVGILDDGYDRVAIFGGRVTHFAVGVLLADAEECSVQGTRLDDCGDNGLYLLGVDESSFVRLRCDNNGVHGVAAVNGYRNRFVSILAHDNGVDGISIVNAALGESLEYNNVVRLCWAAYNGLNGIHVFESHDNRVTQNECVANGRAGIHLETRIEDDASGGLGEPGAHHNEVNRNWCVFNRVGILVGDESTDNTLHDNIALANSDRDLVDDNDAPPCENTWFLNLFLTKDGDGAACIL